MKTKAKIDLDTGVVIDYVTPLCFGEDIIETPMTSSYYRPKWTGTEWIETGTAPELMPQEPSELDSIMLAIADLDLQRELDRTENQLAIAELAEAFIGGGLDG